MNQTLARSEEQIMDRIGEVTKKLYKMRLWRVTACQTLEEAFKKLEPSVTILKKAVVVKGLYGYSVEVTITLEDGTEKKGWIPLRDDLEVGKEVDPANLWCVTYERAGENPLLRVVLKPVKVEGDPWKYYNSLLKEYDELKDELHDVRKKMGKKFTIFDSLTLY